MSRSIIVILAALSVSACAHMQQTSLPKTAAECAAVGGDWTSSITLYPQQELSTRDKNRYICNMRTPDAGRPCSDRINQCQGLCVAPIGSVIGEPATGHCSANVLLPEGTLLIGSGVVLDPEAID